MNKKGNRTVVILVMIAMVICGPFHHLVHAETADQTKALTINQLKDEVPVKTAANISGSAPGYVQHLTSEPLLLQGMEQAYDVYYLVPNAEVGEKNYIELVWNQSDLLEASQSTLTIFVDEQPLKSVLLNGKQNRLTIPLGKSNVTPGYHKVTVAKYSMISDDVCSDPDNPGNWVRIEPASYVSIDAKGTWITDDPLKAFPYPFVERGTLEEVYGVIVVPDAPSADVIAAALELAVHLSAQTAGRKTLPIMTESEWAHSPAAVHVIALGSVHSWNGPIQQVVKEGQLTDNDREFVLQYFTVDRENSDVPAMMLLATAANDHVIRDNMQVLTRSVLTKQLSGARVVIQQTPTATTAPFVPRQLTFAATGYDHVLLDEVKNRSVNLFFPIPAYWKPTGPSYLDLQLRVSALLLAETSETRQAADQQQPASYERNGLTVTINGTPYTIALHELTKDEQEQEKGTYHVRVPLAPALQGEANANAVSISFSANFAGGHGMCNHKRNQDRWILIDKESSLDIPYEVVEESSFQYWPAPFVNDEGWNQTALLVPEQVDGNFLSQLAMLASDLSADASFHNGLTILKEPLDSQAKAALANHNVIVLGDWARYPSITPEQDKLLLFAGEKERALFDYPVLNETTVAVAWIQPSIWNPEYHLAVFQVVDETAKSRGEIIHPPLLHLLKTVHTNSSIAVMSKSEEAFFVDVQQAADHANVPTVDAAATAENDQLDANIPYWIWLVMSIVFVAVLASFVLLWRKEKKDSDES